MKHEEYKLKDRLTSKRVNGIKTGYWSPATKEELVQRLAAYENCELTPEGFQHYIDACERNVGHYLAESEKYEKRCKRAEAAAARQWIKFETRPMDPEERKERSEFFGVELTDDEAFVYVSELPDDGQEILVCSKYGVVWQDTFQNDPDYGCGLENNGDLDGIVAWMPLPKPLPVEG